jgi:hypothetical protein
MLANIFIVGRAIRGLGSLQGECSPFFEAHCHVEEALAV